MAPILTPYSNDGYVFCQHKQLLLTYLLLCHDCGPLCAEQFTLFKDP